MVGCQTSRGHQKRRLAKTYDEAVAVVGVAGGGGRTVVAALCQWWVHSERVLYEYFCADLLTAMILAVVQRMRVGSKTVEAVARGVVVECLEDID